MGFLDTETLCRRKVNCRYQAMSRFDRSSCNRDLYKAAAASIATGSSNPVFGWELHLPKSCPFHAPCFNS